jgi:ubiquitin C-terminal hydrolase
LCVHVPVFCFLCLYLNENCSDPASSAVEAVLKEFVREIPSPACGITTSTSLVVQILFDKFLFELPDTVDVAAEFSTPICKHPDTRQAILNLMHAMALRHPDSLSWLLSQLAIGRATSILALDAPVTPKQRFQQPVRRSAGSYVGLVNQGATCYMNSLMQQLFFTPELRYGLLSCDAGAELSPTDQRTDMFVQLQRMFAFLQESHKQEYHTQSFTGAYRDADGKPMNVHVQMDVDEFLNLLFDRLESKMAGTPQAKLLEHCFGGKIVNQLTGRDCKHVSGREERYLTLSLDIKNKRSVEEALELYVQGEWLDGDNKYMCSQCSKRVDTLKRICIKELPRHLILHLKRFEFDMEEFRKYKVDDFCNIPHELDMQPYTVEGIAKAEAAKEIMTMTVDDVPPITSASTSSSATGSASTTVSVLPFVSSYRYRLRGVLVHMGTSDSGHYYSFIRERQPAATNCDERWFQFNDDRVTVTEFSDLARHINGGPDVSSVDGRPLRLPKNYSAYMLFYDRIDMEATDSTMSNIEVSATALSTMSSTAGATSTANADPASIGFVENTFRQVMSRNAPDQIPRFLNAHHASLLLPSGIAQACRQDNLMLWRSLLVLNPVHIQLTWRLIAESLLQHPPPMDVVELPSGHHATLALRAAVMLTGHALYVMSDRATTLPDWTLQLSLVVSHRPALAGAFLSAVLGDGVWLERQLVSNVAKKEREAISKLLMCTLESLARVESSIYQNHQSAIGNKRALFAGDGTDPATLRVGDVLIGSTELLPKQSVVVGDDTKPLSDPEKTEVAGSHDSTKGASSAEFPVDDDDASADVAPFKKQKISLVSSKAVSSEASASQQALAATTFPSTSVFTANSSRLLQHIVSKLDTHVFKMSAPHLVDIVWKFAQLGRAQRGLLLRLQCLRVLPKVFLSQRSKIGFDGPLEVVLVLNALLNDLNPSIQTHFAVGNGVPEEKMESDCKEVIGENAFPFLSDTAWQTDLSTMSSPKNFVEVLLLHQFEPGVIAQFLCHVMHNDLPRTKAVCLLVQAFLERSWDVKELTLYDNVLTVCWHLIRFADALHSQRAAMLMQHCILKLMQQKVRVLGVVCIPPPPSHILMLI